MQTEQGQAGFMTECKSSPYPSKLQSGTRWVEELTGGHVADVATRWYRAPEIMLSFANYVREPLSPDACLTS